MINPNLPSSVSFPIDGLDMLNYTHSGTRVEVNLVYDYCTVIYRIGKQSRAGHYVAYVKEAMVLSRKVYASQPSFELASKHY